MLFRRSSATASLRKLALLGTLMVSCGFGAAQDQPQAPASTPPQADTGTAQQPATGTGQQQSSEPAPAFGQDNTSAPPPAAENPPISSLDRPSLEAPFLARSYLIPAVQVSQSADTNVGNSIGGSTINGVTRALGSITMQKLLAARSDLGLSYVGGAAFYTGRGTSFTQIHDLSAQDRYLWRTGQFTVRDTFTYLPEGTFGYGSYGGAGNYLGLGSSGATGSGLGGGLGGTQLNFFGPGQFASVGQQSRITNVVIADVIQLLSPRLSFTGAGSYGLVHFNSDTVGLINSRQVSTQVGINYQIGRKDQISVLYGYQDFRYPNAALSNFTTDVVNALYGHRISGRMDLIVGGGPQITNINNPLFGSFRRITFSGRGELRYRFPRTFVSLLYDRYNSAGSGLFTGATSDIARVTVSRPISRRWNLLVDGGYSRNARIVPSFLGVNAEKYSYWYGGGSLNRQLSRYITGFISYQYNRLGFDQSFCGSTNSSCTRTSQRHDAAIGLTWHPRPIRLD